MINVKPKFQNNDYTKVINILIDDREIIIEKQANMIR